MEGKKVKLIKSDTRQWNGGRVRFALFQIEGHPEKNYILFEKDFFGKTAHPPQRFLLRYHDWTNLKRLIDGGQKEDGQGKNISWPSQQYSEADLLKLISQKPELLEVILSAPNIGNFSDISLEALDRLALKVFEVKKENLDLIFKRLAESSEKSLLSFSELLKDLKLSQVSLLSSLIYQKLRILDLLEKIISNPTNKEKTVHEIFENNPWLLGNKYEIIQSNRTLAEYLDLHTQADPETKKRPDLLVRRIPHTNDLVIVEFKAPGIKLKAENIGQVLTYKAIIQNYQPNVKNIFCFIFGYEKSPTFSLSNDVTIKTFAELIGELRDEYLECSKVLEVGKEEEMPVIEAAPF